MNLKGWLLAGAVGCAMASPAMAQDAAVEELVVYGHADKSTDAAIGLELTPRETPQSIMAITEQQIEDQALSTVSDVLAFATGISAKAVDRGRNTLSARGFEITNFQIDGAPFQTGNVGFDETSTAIYERVEIVRGATGLLNGAGEPSASINLIRKHADSAELTGSLRLEAGTWDRFAATGDVSFALNSAGTVRGRIVAQAYTQDAFVDLEETQGYVFYGVVDADLSERTTLSIGGAYQRDERSGVMWGQLPYWFSDGTRTDWRRSKTTGTDWNQWDTEDQTAFVMLKHGFANGWSLRADLGYHRQVENSKLLWISGYPNAVTGLGMEAGGYWYDSRPRQWNARLMAQGPFRLFGRDHELVAGAMYNHLRGGWTNRDPTPGWGPAPNFLTWTGASYPEPAWGPRYEMSDKGVTEQLAVYSAGRFNLTDDLKVILGGRLSSYKRKEEVAVYTPAAYTISHDGIFTPYAGVVYDLTEAISAYASYTSIFKNQTARDRNGDYLDPLEGDAYEAGLKAEFLGGRLLASAAVFRVEQNNFAVPDPGFFVPGTTTPASRAAKGKVSEGYEIEVSGQITPQWEINLGWTDYDAEDADGADVVAHHPRQMLKLATVYDLQDVVRGLRVGGSLRWESRPPQVATNPGTGAVERVGQPAYAIVGLMAEYQINERVSAQVNVNNVFDKTYFSNNAWFAGYIYGEPRNVRVTLEYKF
ncbi:TonB-dependent siderophore receptor [Phenylobacterium sp. VNQ135]|uniref:TonB-dependent siderophore receptor n=1 Tax=Phenylobacterium sp. VNQ135 TaxID=3400922 RepID=UPI003C04D9A8